MSKYDDMSLEQLQALKASNLQDTQARAERRNAYDSMSLEQLQALKQSKANNPITQQQARESTVGGLLDQGEGRGLGSLKDTTNPLIPIGASLNKYVAEPIQTAITQVTGTPEDVAKLKAQQSSERAQYENTPVGKSSAASILQGATSAGLAMTPVGGASLSGQVAANAAIGGALANPGERVAGAVEGAVATGLIGGATKAIGKGFTALGNKIKATPDAVTLGQATGNKTFEWVDQALSKVPLTATKKALTQQIEDVKAKTADFTEMARSMDPDTVGAELANSMAKVHSRVSDISAKQFTELARNIDQTAVGSTVRLSKTKTIAGEVLAKLSSNVDDGSKSAVDQLKQLLDTDATTFSEARNVQTLVHDQYSRLKRLDSPTAKAYEPIIKAVDQEVGRIADASGYGKDWNTAQSFYRNRVLPLRDNQYIDKGIKAGQKNLYEGRNVKSIRPDKAVSTLLKGTPEEIKTLVSSLDGKGKNALKNTLLSDTYNKAIIQSGEKIGQIDPIKFRKGLSDGLKGLGLLGDQVTAKAAKGLVNATEVINRNPILLAKSGTSINKYLGISAVVGGSLFNAPAVAAILTATAVISKMTASKGTLKQIMKLGEYNKNDPRLPGMVRDLLIRTVNQPSDTEQQ